MGVGEKFEPAQGQALPAGSFLRMSKGVRHYEWTKGETIIYVYGLGPLETMYVNPTDDPRRKDNQMTNVRRLENAGALAHQSPAQGQDGEVLRGKENNGEEVNQRKDPVH